MDILMNYAFQIIALGTALLAAVAAPVGALSVYKGQSLIGDAIGHATFPGVVLAFMAFSTRSPAVLLGNRERLTLKEIIAERRVPVSKEDFEKYALGYGWRRKVNSQQQDYACIRVAADGRVVYHGRYAPMGRSSYYSFCLKGQMMRAFRTTIPSTGENPIYRHCDYVISSYDASRNALLLENGVPEKEQKELWKPRYQRHSFYKVQRDS